MLMVIPVWVVKWLEGKARITRTLRVSEPELEGMIHTLLFNKVEHIEIVLSPGGWFDNSQIISDMEACDEDD